MTNNIGKPNPKALKLEGLENINKKVTVGFKCHPRLKLYLANEAKKSGLTLSEFIETLIQQLETAIQIEKTETDKLKKQLAFYENDILLNLFKEYENRNINIKTASGTDMAITIKEPRDVYTVLINSFKHKK
jgi:hypothetical protein